MAEADPPASPPSAEVLDAFSATGRPEPLSGGRHGTWRVGDIVLKPADISKQQLTWQAALHERLRTHDGFRVPEAVRAHDGRLLVNGWYAMTYLQGRHEPGRWLDIIDVGARFHEAVAGEPAPGFLAERTDPWSIGDRVAWGELAATDVPETKHLERLLALVDPISAPSQLIHGDLTGNVLFDDQRPAILDLSPYVRPATFASAIVVADALVWEGADKTLARAFDADDRFPQYFLRALIYRIVTDRLFRLDEPLRPNDADPYAMPVDIAERLAGR
ncbi:MAG TPA: TIGR02569 family protein [Actinomycetota bacterium]|nr:TIGR02569 family protein [Actinomycetota bacterium]